MMLLLPCQISTHAICLQITQIILKSLQIILLLRQQSYMLQLPVSRHDAGLDRSSFIAGCHTCLCGDNRAVSNSCTPTSQAFCLGSKISPVAMLFIYTSFPTKPLHLQTSKPLMRFSGISHIRRQTISNWLKIQCLLNAKLSFFYLHALLQALA